MAPFGRGHYIHIYYNHHPTSIQTHSYTSEVVWRALFTAVLLWYCYHHPPWLLLQHTVVLCGTHQSRPSSLCRLASLSAASITQTTGNAHVLVLQQKYTPSSPEPKLKPMVRRPVVPTQSSRGHLKPSTRPRNPVWRHSLYTIPLATLHGLSIEAVPRACVLPCYKYYYIPCD